MTEPISRRDALRLGLLGAGAVVIGGLGLAGTERLGPFAPATGTGARQPSSGAEFVQPPVLRSRDGLLRAHLEPRLTDVGLGGPRARLLSYGGTVPAATWRVRPGDRIEVTLANRLDIPTNLHVHGLHVSPEGNGDNVFLRVEPGEEFHYEFALPHDHPPGLFWYHPHVHGTVADQVFAGLYGAIVVEDDLPVDGERVLVISDVTLREDGTVATATPPERMAGREGALLLVNGRHRPILRTKAGRAERWRLLNACTSRYLDLELPGQELVLLGMDGGPLPPRQVEHILLPPGGRADILVTTSAGGTELRTAGYDRGGGMMMMGPADLSGPARLADVAVSESPSRASLDLPTPSVTDLRGATPDARRDIAFTMGMGMGGMTFGFDGLAFAAERTDQRLSAGAIEEWTIRNPTPFDHPFHLHVWPMQVLDDDGRHPEAPEWRDVVNVPSGGAVTVRFLVDITGRTVYHCHILDHEDAGMMAVVDARP